MTDLAKFRTLLEEFGIVHTIKHYSESHTTVVSFHSTDVIHYWYFDNNGKFSCAGAE